MVFLELIQKGRGSGKVHVLAFNAAHVLRFNKADVLASNKAHVTRVQQRMCVRSYNHKSLS